MLSKGYYLSIYISISDIGYVMNEFIRHDQNMALWWYDGDKITLCHYWEFERYTGLKHQFRAFYSLKQATDIINQLLKEYDLSLEDMQAVWGTPELEHYSRLQTDIRKDKRFSLHSYAHLFSSILLNSEYFYNDTILALEVDGGPDGAYGRGLFGEYLYIGAIIEKGDIKEYFPIESPALLWNELRVLTGLEEGTLMALGSASTCNWNNLQIQDYEIYNYSQAKRGCTYITHLYNEIMSMSNDSPQISSLDSNFSERENKISAIVKILTEISIRMMQRNIKQAIEKYHISPDTTCLSLSGGFALNCPINSIMMKTFKKILLAPPCINDSGISLGLGLYEFYNHLEYVKFDLKNAYYGKEITKEEMDDFIKNETWSQYILKVTQIDYNEAVKDIINAPVVWVNGRAEIGPRALGGRSLIGDPRNVAMKDMLNVIKQRQWWRPVAPIVLEEHIQEWFKDAYPTKYMLNTFYIREEKESFVPAILHLDHSARVQTLEQKDNEILYQLIKQYYKITGIPIICNTSLNDIGQPIINNIENTIIFALKKKIKVVYINGYRFELNIDDGESDNFKFIYPVDFNIDEEQLAETGEKYKRMKENLSESEIRMVISNPGVFMNYDIQKASDAKAIRRIINLLKSKG